MGSVGIPANECITLCRQRSGVVGGSVIRNILAGGWVAVLGDKAYFVILGCPLGVNFGIARDGSAEVKLCGVGSVGIPAIECITLCRQRSGVFGGSVIRNILAGGCVAVLGDKAYFVIVGCPLGVNRGVALDGLGKVKLCGVGSVGIPADECITLCRQRSGVFGGSVIRNILAGGCVAVLGDKAYFVIVGCPLGVNRGVARDGLGKVKLGVIFGIPVIECITLYLGNGELVGIDEFAVFNRLIRKRTVVGYEFDRVLVDVPRGNQLQHIGGIGGVGVKIKFFIAVVPACKGVVFFGGSSGFRKLSAAVNDLGGSKRCAVRRKSSFQYGADKMIFQYVVVAALGNVVPLRFGTGIGYSHQARTVSKSIVSNGSDRDWNVNRGQLRAAEKKSL